MGGKQSTSSSGRPSQPGAGDSRAAAGPLASLLSPVSTSSGDPRLRARSLSSVLSIPAPSQSPESPVESGSSTPDGTPFGRVFAAHSLPVHLVSFNGEPSPSARNPVSLVRLRVCDLRDLFSGSPSDRHLCPTGRHGHALGCRSLRRSRPASRSWLRPAVTQRGHALAGDPQVTPGGSAAKAREMKQPSFFL
uniref:Putative e3 ubiquitin-protein lig n=1 Tax=Ixodes ricinus TaxID=34613 RepID=A0A147BIG8_IXORI